MNENDLIKQKDTEIDILIRKNARLKDEVSELRAEIERLQNERIERIRELTRVVYDKEIAEIKSEARKELAERLKLIIVLDLCEAIDCSEYLNDILPEKIDNLLAEMESERG